MKKPIGNYTDPGPLGRRLVAAGLGTLREVAQGREDALVAAEIAELDALGYGDTADLVREKLTGRLAG